MSKTTETASPARPLPYYNRELSWMDFNMRVLEECFEKENPVMERMRFLAITASNLDEFFMVRVAGVMEKIRSKVQRERRPKRHDAGGTLRRPVRENSYLCGKAGVLPSPLHPSGTGPCGHPLFLRRMEWTLTSSIIFPNISERCLFPVLTPLAVDRSRPFPFLANRSLNIAVRLESGGRV